MIKVARQDEAHAGKNGWPRPVAVLTAVALLLQLPVPQVRAQAESWQAEWPNTDFSHTAVDLAEIMSGGPSRDGIPSIDDPKFAAVGEVDLPGNEPVLSVQVGDNARAYPLRILMWHEIVNDTVGGVPLAITYCPLCNTGLVFKREIAGRVLEFGTSGMLRNSDLVMYDRQTESWWQQFTGTAIVGALTGTRLPPWPSRLESVARFAERHPDGFVLVPTDEDLRLYGQNPYFRYDSRNAPYQFFNGELPQGIAPLARVVRVGDRAWSLDLLRQARRIETDDLVLTWEPGQASALDETTIAESFDVGNVVVQRKTSEGLVDEIYTVDFAFAFHAFYPDSTIVTE